MVLSFFKANLVYIAVELVDEKSPSICHNLLLNKEICAPIGGLKGPFLGKFVKMDLCRKILIHAYTSLI